MNELNDALQGVVVVLSIAAFYLLPSIVGSWRAMEHKNALLLVNLVMGWTGLGWLGCLVWAMLGGPKSKKRMCPL